MRKTLILALSALRDPWHALMRKQRETWDSIPNEQTRTVFYVGTSDRKYFEDQVLHSQIDESLEMVGSRTVEALEFALQFFNWDFMARVHSSTYVHKRRLVEFVETLPDDPVIYGLETPGPIGPYLWGGGHYVLSRAAVEILMAHKEDWDHGHMEDVAMSKLALDNGILFGKGRCVGIDWKPCLTRASCVVYNGARGGFDFSDFKELDALDDQFFYRVKHDPDRTVDLRTMDLLHANLTQ